VTEKTVASAGEAGAGEAIQRKIRAFVAVPLPANVQADVLGAAVGLAAVLPDVKWSQKVENLHVTLKFLGNVAPPQLEALAAALTEQTLRRAAFPVTVRGFGAFPDPQHATTIWAGVEDEAGGLAEVAASVDSAAMRLGLTNPRRSFCPHVTVGRCKRGVDVRGAFERWRTHAFGTLTVTALHVYESRLGGAGSTYVLRGRAPLAPLHFRQAPPAGL
jgi:2'-5' RNA ligase